MATPTRRGRLMTLQELLSSQREVVPARCAHCGRDSADQDNERVQRALQVRIRILEAKLSELQVHLAARRNPA